MNKQTEVILFDLGGVLIELGPSPFPPEWLPKHEDFNLSDWSQSETALAFERGNISPKSFANTMKQQLGIKADIDEIIANFTKWPVGLYPGAHEILVNLKKSYNLVVLTNTNELHWPRIIGEFRLPQYFSKIFASHQMHKAKPEKAVYQYVLDELNIAPGKVLFFDDNLQNVHAAEQLGIISLQVRSIDEVVHHLIQNRWN